LDFDGSDGIYVYLYSDCTHSGFNSIQSEVHGVFVLDKLIFTRVRLTPSLEDTRIGSSMFNIVRTKSPAEATNSAKTPSGEVHGVASRLHTFTANWS
jgi:hypothetical protein